MNNVNTSKDKSRLIYYIYVYGWRINYCTHVADSFTYDSRIFRSPQYFLNLKS